MGTQRLPKGNCRALGAHSKGNQRPCGSLKHFRHSGTSQALGHLGTQGMLELEGHFGTWALKWHLDSQALKRHGYSMYFIEKTWEIRFQSRVT